MAALFASSLFGSRLGQLALAVLAGLAVGWWQGHAYSNAEIYRSQVAALTKAADVKDKLQQIDQQTAYQSEQDRQLMAEQLQKVLNATSKTDNCRLSDDALKRLRGLAGSRSGYKP